ncbi:LysR family transcriptional regulator [Klebsiella pneumoniae]|uniref:LysR family transcriptional regulator n=1 Tax=Klebsiella pneumoniae TaxID=573 RepID=A0A377XKZ1_KLEPN|nr:LysR family transcriptional regulator [Klebsiella pneumoniae]
MPPSLRASRFICAVFESTHELLLEQLSQHKLDMIISDCPIDSTQQEGLFSVKIGECSVSSGA